jgi:N-acetylmuramoyl-L-alanine amidase
LKMITRRQFICSVPAAYLWAKDALAKHERILINPGHNKEHPGFYRKEVGDEHKINLGISRLLKGSLSDVGIESILAREEQYIKPILDYQAAHKAELLNQIRIYWQGLCGTREENLERLESLAKHYWKKNRRNGLTIEKALLQLSIASWADTAGFSAVLNIHVNDSKNGNEGYAVITSENNTSPRNRDLAYFLHEEMRLSGVPSNSEGESSRIGGVKVPGFMVSDYVVIGSPLRRMKTPSAIIECGHACDHYGGLYVSDQRIQQMYADAICHGTYRFLNAPSS